MKVNKCYDWCNHLCKVGTTEAPRWCHRWHPIAPPGGATFFSMPADHTTKYEQGGTTRYFHFYVEFLYLMVFDRLTNRPTDIPKHFIWLRSCWTQIMEIDKSKWKIKFCHWKLKLKLKIENVLKQERDKLQDRKEYEFKLLDYQQWII